MNAQAAQAQSQSLSPSLSVATDLLTGTEWNAANVQELFRLAADVKAHPERYKTALAGRQLAMIFEKPSLRTRVTFEVGITSMGGSAIYLDHADTHLGDREAIQDVGRCLSRWVHGIVARVFSQEGLEMLAAYATVPVINALSDVYHPCQTLCDFFTLEEKFGSVRGLKFAYVGDGNNVCHSLLYLGARLGVNLRIATPANYAPDDDVIADSRRVAKETKAKIELFTDPRQAVEEVQAVYTDSWTSMGFEAEEKVRSEVFKPYQVNRKLMAIAGRGSVFMHCLPAHRGHEVTSDVLDGAQSVVLDQSENRMYVQKAILHTLFR